MKVFYMETGLNIEKGTTYIDISLMKLPNISHFYAYLKI